MIKEELQLPLLENVNEKESRLNEALRNANRVIRIIKNTNFF